MTQKGKARGKRKVQGLGKDRPYVPPPLDEETGLPPVGRGLRGEGERAVARAREKHLHKQRYRR